jgi:2-polyprenyl-6-methoxyphenol hydroxylase-like FAD-dependent oxidoreductase
MKQGGAQRRQTALVVGASMAGLSAAAVLASRFREVVLVDRDVLADRPTERRGVPQGRHAHGLLPAGHRRIEAWFPGFTEDLLADGARQYDFGEDVVWYQGDGPRVRFRSGVQGPVCSRALLEHHFRRHVLALANVSLHSGSGVTGVTASPDGRTVTGVTLEDGSSLAADLVVDASGRAGRSVRWLSNLGYEEPQTSIVTIDVGYATRVFRMDPTRRQDWGVALVFSPPPGGRQGVLFPLEGDRWMVTLAGFHGDHPPRDPEGFLAFARTLPSPIVAEVIESSVPLGQIVTHRLPSNQRRHVERLRRVPGGLVMLGDAVCSFNPVYGQGMSSATLQAEALGAALDAVRTLDDRFVRHFYRRAAKAITPVWQMSTGADFALPATTGPKAPGTDLINRYMARVLRASQVSEEICLRLVEVTTLLRPPRDLMTPAMVAKVRRTIRGMGSSPTIPLGEHEQVWEELAEVA